MFSWVVVVVVSIVAASVVAVADADAVVVPIYSSHHRHPISLDVANVISGCRRKLKKEEQMALYSVWEVARCFGSHVDDLSLQLLTLV